MTNKINTQQQQAILARDMIDMAREYGDDANALEYISSMCFTLYMLFEDDPTIDWHELFSIYDNKYYSLQQEGMSRVDESSVDKIRCKAIEIIKTHEKTST